MFYPSDINVLIACEESQVEMRAFRERGFNAFSCDLQKPARGGNIKYHIQGDVSALLKGRSTFQTMDGHDWRLPSWDLIIAHPPCTYLCKVGSVHMWKDGQLDEERYAKMWEARTFFMECYTADALFVAVENPLPMARAKLPKPDAFVEPNWYGSGFTKKTLYWLRNLPPLMPEIINPDTKEFVRASRGKYRSRTFQGVAEAMAKQWGDYILHAMNHDF